MLREKAEETGKALLFSFVVAWLSFVSGVRAAPAPPAQPADGPGGRSYVHASMKQFGPYWANFSFWDNSRQYYIFEPADPAPESAPVVLFLHGWLSSKPDGYLEWIRHMVRKGYIVVWARYDAFFRPFTTFADNAVETWAHALGRLQNRPWENHVTPATDRLGQIETAIVGHSAGGYLSAIVAARAADYRYAIPRPRAVVAIEPGALGWIPYEDLGAIDPDTKFLVVIGDEDDAVCKATAQTIWSGIPQVPDAIRDFLVVMSENYGKPDLVASLWFPNTPGYFDTAHEGARDYFVT